MTEYRKAAGAEVVGPGGLLRGLPFVATEKSPKGQLLTLGFWSVEPAKDRFDHWAQGEELALTALDYMVTQSRAPGWLLASVVMDMPRAQDRTAVELGFLNCIGAFAAIYRLMHGNGFYRKAMQKCDEARKAFELGLADTRPEAATGFVSGRPSSDEGAPPTTPSRPPSSWALSSADDRCPSWRPAAQGLNGSWER